ncbi:MAG: MBL fold metallo-hydrolase [Alphaproteobacteria bacterium]|nr:MBL fold metallo-hydrolase [Alphaproteobacteria bacterium]
MTLTRRAFTTTALLSGASALAGRWGSTAAAAAQVTQDPATPLAQYKVGDATISAIYDGVWERPYMANVIANASVEDVKAALGKAKLPDAFLTLPFTVSVISSGDQLILCDAGTGGQVVPTAGHFMENFKAAGFDAAKVTKILISHCHPDHIYGLMEKGSNAPVFPNAEIMISDAEYKWWTDPAVFNKLPEDRKPLAQRIQAVFPTWKNITQVSGEKEVAPGVSFVEAPGHTPGHRAFLLASGNAQHMFSNDTMYMPALNVAHPDWLGAFDQDAATAVASRRKMMDRLAADGIAVSGYHFPFPAYGKIAKDGADYVLTVEKA